MALRHRIPVVIALVLSAAFQASCGAGRLAVGGAANAPDPALSVPDPDDATMQRWVGDVADRMEKERKKARETAETRKKPYAPLPVPDPDTLGTFVNQELDAVLKDAAARTRDWHVLQGLVQRVLRLPPDRARTALAAWLAQEDVDGIDYEEFLKQDAKEQGPQDAATFHQDWMYRRKRFESIVRVRLSAIEPLVRKGFLAAPDRPWAIATMAAQMGRLNDPGWDKAFVRRIEAGDPSPVAAYAALRTLVDAFRFWPGSVEPLVALTRREGRIPLATRFLQARGAGHKDSAYPPDLDAAWQELVSRTPPASPAVMRLFAAERIYQTLQFEPPARALAAWRDLPPDLRNDLVAGPLPRQDVDVDGLPVMGLALDLRPGIAAALVGAGDLDTARVVLGDFPAEGPFMDWNDDGSWYDLAEGMRRPAKALVTLLREVLHPAAPDPWALAADLSIPGRLPLRDGVNRAFLAAHGWLPPETGDAASSDALAARWAAPATTVFKEVPAAEPPAAPADPLPGKLELPGGFDRVDGGALGQKIAMLAESQALDPTGEVTEGGYWLLLSDDGGRTWRRPAYLGLRVERPYKVERLEIRPLLEGGVVRLGARHHEIVESSIRLPPVGLKYGPERAGLVLEARLDEVLRDTDRDGIPDMEEERTGTDPASRDTDGDGVGDALDPLPLVAEGPAGPIDEILTAVLEREAGSAPLGIKGGSMGTGLKLLGGRAPWNRTLFLVADRAAFAGLRSLHRRIVVLSPDEKKAMDARFGRTFPMTINVLALDLKGQRAVIYVDHGWRGGTWLLHKVDGRWKFESHGGYITRSTRERSSHRHPGV